MFVYLVIDTFIGLEDALTNKLILDLRGLKMQCIKHLDTTIICTEELYSIIILHSLG